MIPETINSEVNSLKKWNNKDLKVNFIVEETTNKTPDGRSREC